MTNAIFNHMSKAIMVSVEASEEGGLAFLLLWENTAEIFVQLFLLFPLLSLYLTLRIPPYFFFRKHKHSQLTRSQGEHDHGNDAGDQSQWRISGKWAGRVFLFGHQRRHQRTPVNYPYQTQKED